MDTGCDPGAPGLQVTSHGLPKIIDCVDCTGSGDVDTSTVLEKADELKSPHTGRSLKLGSGTAWSNPTGKWHVGMKKAYELFDSDLVKRVQKERAAAWDETQRGYLADVHRKLAAFDAANPKPEGEAVRRRKDLEEQIVQLNGLQKEKKDHGLIMDVIAWYDGTNWRAAISGDGDFTAAPALANFAVEKQWASFGELEQMNYCLNTYDDGSVVSVVCDISSHGTHVAGIAAACHPEEPERNGVAPGAQVVALKIADTRLDAMETGTGLARGFAHCIRAKVDLVNLSFGEGSSPATVGRVVELAKRAVGQHGITFVTSAGNDGPGLSTIGAPGNGSDIFVTIGAHVSPPAMEAQYSMLEKQPSTPYTWSSRGPTQDGSLGVTVCAPGSAITCVPNWTLSGAQLMNGTSMAAPNAAGCIALVLSALKATCCPSSPASLHRALLASALPLPGDPFAVGAGMIQVDSCFEYMTANKDLPYRDVTIAATLQGGGRGIYLREANQAGHPKVFTMRLDPSFKELDPSLNRSKIDMELNLSLVATAPWIKVPPYVVVPSAGRSIQVSVDPSALQADEAHLAFVQGFDTAKPQLGALFRFPVTVLRPLAPKTCPQLQESALFRTSPRCVPGSIHRSFVAVPAGCTWAEMTLTTKAFTGANRVMIVHVLQDIPHVPGSKSREEFAFVFPVAGVQKRSFRVEASATLEVTLAQNWSSLGETEADLEVSFHGITPEVSTISMSTEKPCVCVHVTSGPGAVLVKPSASLTVHRTVLRPKSSSIQPGGERDVFPEGKVVYELLLEYDWKLAEGGDVTPQALLLNDRLYESVFESQLLMVFDSNKRFVACFDAWPTPVKFSKGNYTVKLQIRHDDVALLERFKQMPLAFDKKLEKAIAVKAYPSFNQAIAAQGELEGAKVKGGTRLAVFFSLAVDEKLPAAVKAGDMLLGAVSYGEPMPAAAGKKTRGGFTVQYAVTASSAQEAKDTKEAEEDGRTVAEKLADAVRDAQIKHLESLRKLATQAEHKALLAELLAAHPKHLPLHLERLAALEEVKDPKASEDAVLSRLADVVSAADELLASVDLNALAAQRGRRVDQEDKKAVQAAKECDKEHDAVVRALTSKVLALAKQTEKTGTGAEKVAAAYKELSQWVDVTEAKHARVTALYEKALQNLGLALAALNKQMGEEKAPTAEVLQERAELLEALGWKAWADQERLGLIVNFPKSFARL
eukprot:TRINITY_DN29771_c0_g1_i1.p1 TRINITY_DN29771_c0_g1~~TRINITY_DN29771_c0_g1_i1.p1  ORF type:complete len:1260 (+),score=292.17 TRINITY_DN29771_c0_g1_i1:143-3781(+)